MNTPMHACEWASQKGYELKLSCPERVTLWQLARRAASKGFCWPSISTLRDDTGLARQTILTVVKKLAALGLIRIEKDGQRQFYHLVRPVQNETDRSKSEPVHAHPTGLKSDTNRSKIVPATGLNLNPNLKENQKKNPKAQARAGRSEPAASSQRSDGALAAAPSHNQNGTPPPVVSEEAPVAPDAVRSLVAGVIGALRVAPPPRAAPPEPDIPVRRGPVDAIRTVEQQQAQLAVWIAQEAAASAARLHGTVS